MKNVIVSREHMVFLMDLSFSHACFKEDSRIVFNGIDFVVEVGNGLSGKNENGLVVGGVFRYKYLSKLKIPQGDKMSKKFPELTEFQVWKAKRNYHYFNAIYNGFWWGGINIVHKGEENGLHGLIPDIQTIEVTNEYSGKM